MWQRPCTAECSVTIDRQLLVENPLAYAVLVTQVRMYTAYCACACLCVCSSTNAYALAALLHHTESRCLCRTQSLLQAPRSKASRSRPKLPRKRPPPFARSKTKSHGHESKPERCLAQSRAWVGACLQPLVHCDYGRKHVPSSRGSSLQAPRTAWVREVAAEATKRNLNRIEATSPWAVRSACACG